MPSTAAERVTVIRCRSWPLIGAGYRLDDLAAVVVANRVVSTSASAEHSGVTVGLRRREAQRRAPGLAIVAPDPAGEARAFEPVLRALDDLTPRVEIGERGVCCFLTRGPSRYFGGDRAMGARVAAAVAGVIEGRTTVHVGTADARFAAMRAASMASADQARVVEAGQSAHFLAPLDVRLLAADAAAPAIRKVLDDLVDVLVRLGLTTLGSFAALDSAEVVARFGEVGRRAHRWARGDDDRRLAAGDPLPELVISQELDPVIERVDQAAFVARTLAETFIERLQERGMSSARVEIHAETEHGETQTRLWRSDEAFGAAAIAERLRWQLDGWLSGPVRQRPTGGLALLSLRPDDLSVASGRQLGFWGEETGRAERAARAIARVQGLTGVGTVFVPEVRGGRHPAEMVAAIPAEAVDLVERAASVDRTLIGGTEPAAQGAQAGLADGDLGGDDGQAGRTLGARVVAGAHGAAAGVRGEQAMLPWPGQLPAPYPAVVHLAPKPVSIIDAHGHEVAVDGRGLMRAQPAWLTAEGTASAEVVAWSGPWLLDERWWQSSRHRRSARMQIVIGDGRAFVVATRAGRWVLEATYD